MRVLWGVPLLVVALSGVQGHAQARKHHAPPAKRPVAASGKTIFRDAKLGIQFSYPSYLVQDPTAPGQTGCVTTPVDAKHKTATDDDTLSILKVNFATCGNRPATQDSVETGMMGSLALPLRQYDGDAKVAVPKRYVLNGYPASYFALTTTVPKKGPGAMVYVGSSCVLVGKVAECFSIYSADKRKVQDVMSGSVVFRGHVGVPLVPVGLLGK